MWLRRFKEAIPLGNSLVALVFACIVSIGLISLSKENKQLVYQLGIQSAFAPFFELISSIRDGFRLSEDNERLRQENAKLRTMVYQREQDVLENIRLREMLRLPPRYDYPARAAIVTARDPSPLQSYLTLNLGSRDSVTVGMPVFTSRGVVGRVIRTAETYSDVILLDAPESRVSVFSQRSRVGGVMQSLDGNSLYVMVSPTSDLVIGDVMVTTGWGGVYPKGMPVGRVIGMDSGPVQSLRKVWIQPFQDLQNFEEVFILKHPMRLSLEDE